MHIENEYYEILTNLFVTFIINFRDLYFCILFMFYKLNYDISLKFQDLQCTNA